MPQQKRIPRQNPREEAALAHGLASRDGEAVAAFVERAHGAVFALALRLSADPDLRRDWTHAVLLRLVQELGSGAFVYRRPGSLWAWFRKRAYYLMLNQLNEHRRRGRQELRGEELDAALLGLAAAGASPIEELERAETRRLVEAALASIENRDQRRALWLLLDQELSYQEIALAMGAELNTVRSWIRRGRLAMRSFLLARLTESGPSEEVA